MINSWLIITTWNINYAFFTTLADGPGFHPFDHAASFAIESSLADHEIKEDWESPLNRSYPISITLENDIYSSTPRFIQITISSETIVSGLQLETYK